MRKTPFLQHAHLAGLVLALLLGLGGFSAPARAGGTHFLVEPFSGLIFNQGFNLEDALGFESGGLLAIGGKFTGFPPRFYLYMKASYANFGTEDVFIPSRAATACVQRSYTKWMGGLRTLIPIYKFNRLRLQLEVGAGKMFSQNRYAEGGRTLVDYDESLVAVELGAGLNLRLFRWLSLGLMYNYTFVAEEENGDMIATMLGESDYGRGLGWSHLNATLGFHF